MKYHDAVTQFSCKLCSLFYDSEQSLNKHITKTHNRRYDCTICNESFINKKHLRSHQAREHKQLIAESRLLPAGSLAKTKKAVCSLCNSVFFNRYVLSKHLMSIHRLPEQDMKELLNIRKKGPSKNQTHKEKTRDLSMKDVDHDKNFRVYYKDEEMAVYVKGTDDFETRLKAMTESSETNKDGNKGEEEVRYIVLEDNGMGNVNDFNEVTYSNGDNEDFDLKKSDIKRVDQSPEAGILVITDCVEERDDEVVNSESSEHQNYYVVFTEATENSEKMVEEVHSEVIVKEELQNLTDDGTERIVLILNEGDDGKNIMLENGEQIQILSNSVEYLPAGTDKDVNEFEVMTTDPMNVTGEMNCQKSFVPQDETFICKGSNPEPAVLEASGNINNCNLPLLEQFQTRDLVSEAEKVGNIPDKANNIERHEHFHNVIPSLVVSENAATKEIMDMQYQRLPETKSTDLEKGNYVFVQAEHNNEAQSSVDPEVSKETIFTDMETNTIEEFLPRNNSSQEFTNFENALKLKSGDFENQDEYNKFIDKMIQTLQKAKQPDQH